MLSLNPSILNEINNTDEKHSFVVFFNDIRVLSYVSVDDIDDDEEFYSLSNVQFDQVKYFINTISVIRSQRKKDFVLIYVVGQDTLKDEYRLRTTFASRKHGGNHTSSACKIS